MTQEGMLLTFDAMYNLALDSRERGKLDEALEMLQLLSLLAPRDAGVWQALARCHDDLGQHQAAELVRQLARDLEQRPGEEGSCTSMH